MSTAHAAGGEAGTYRHGMKSLGGVTMAEALKRLGPSVQSVPLETSNFVTPYSILFTLDGATRRWDAVESHASVAVLLYRPAPTPAVILVRQFRPAVYVAACREAAAAGAAAPLPLSVGFTYELCAGIVDKAGLDLAQIAREEVSEECGYDVPLDSIRLITSYLTAIGISGARQSIFAAEVDESMATAETAGGLRDHGEAIEVLALPMSSLQDFLFDESLGKSAGLLFALTWLQARLAGGGRLSGGD